MPGVAHLARRPAREIRRSVARSSDSTSAYIASRQVQKLPAPAGKRLALAAQAALEGVRVGVDEAGEQGDAAAAASAPARARVRPTASMRPSAPIATCMPGLEPAARSR